MVCQKIFYSDYDILPNFFFKSASILYLNAAELNAIVHIRSKEGDIVLPLI